MVHFEVKTGKGVSSIKESSKMSSVKKNLLLEMDLIPSPNMFLVAII